MKINQIIWIDDFVDKIKDYLEGGMPEEDAAKCIVELERVYNVVGKVVKELC